MNYKICPTLKKLGWNLRQFPVVSCWMFLIAIAHRKKSYDFVICDISADQSVFREKFFHVVDTALIEIFAASPKLSRRTRTHINYIARASIPNDYQYYSSVGLLLIKINCDKLEPHKEIVADIVEAATLGYLRKRNVDIFHNRIRIQKLLDMQIRM